MQGTKGTQASRLTPLSYAACRETTLKTFESQELECVTLTHASRHSGTIEAQRIGLRAEDIKLGGRWVRGSGRMDQHYMSNIPIPFAFGMAGVKDGKPFHLKRNEKAPSIELQEKIFPFIETAFGEPGSEMNKRWRQECVDDMNEKDEDQPEELEGILPLDSPEAEPGVRPIHSAHIAMNKKRFFKLLVRMRRIILQDAVVYLHRYKNVKSPLLENDVFTSDLFLQFQDQLVPLLDQDDALLPLDLPPIMADAITSQQQLYSSHFHQLIDRFQQLGSQVQQLQVQQQQLMQQPVERQVLQQDGQEDPFRLYMVNELNEVRRSLGLLTLWLQGPYASYPSATGPPAGLPYPGYSFGEQVQHHTAIYQSTSRVPWLGPTLPPSLRHLANPEAQPRPPTDPTTSELNPLPAGWERRQTDDGRIYFMNINTQETTFLKPTTSTTAATATLPASTPMPTTERRLPANPFRANVALALSQAVPQEQNTPTPKQKKKLGIMRFLSQKS